LKLEALFLALHCPNNEYRVADIGDLTICDGGNINGRSISPSHLGILGGDLSEYPRYIPLLLSQLAES
jgi:hypothetical protein